MTPEEAAAKAREIAGPCECVLICDKPLPYGEPPKHRDYWCRQCLRTARISSALLAAYARGVEDGIAEAKGVASGLRAAAINACEWYGCEGGTPDGSCGDYKPHDLCQPCELSAAINGYDDKIRTLAASEAKGGAKP